jgi:hypothetical protein
MSQSLAYMNLPPTYWYYAKYGVKYADGTWEETYREEVRTHTSTLFGIRLLEVMACEFNGVAFAVKLYGSPNPAHVPDGSVWHDNELYKTYIASRSEWFDYITATPIMIDHGSWSIEYVPGENEWRMEKPTTDVGMFWQGSLDEVFQLLEPVRGYCPQCNTLRPTDEAGNMCRPCYNQGHNYRIVNSDADRLWRIELWRQHHERFNYSEENVAKIPSWINLNNPPTGWDEYKEMS